MPSRRCPSPPDAEPIIDSRAESARDYFRTVADKLHKRAPNDSHQDFFRAFAYQGFADNVWPLELSYGAPSYSLLRADGESFMSKFLPDNYEKYGRLKEALSKTGAPPTDINGRRLLSGSEQHDRVVSHPNYYVAHADNQIIEDHIRAYSIAMDGANVVELCVGTGEKAAHIARQVMAIGAKPKKFYLNDIVQESRKKAVEEMTEALGPAYGPEKTSDYIADVPGDIFSEGFRALPVWQELRQDRAPTVVMIHGATFNNFAVHEMLGLLKMLRDSFKPDTTFMISIDSTCHNDTLMKAYNYSEVAQWLTTGFVFGCWSMRFNPDVNAIGFKLPPPEEHKHHVALRPHITIDSDQPMGPFKIADGKKPVFVLRASEIPTDEIRKLRPDFVSRLLKRAGMRIVSVMDFRGTGPFKHVDQNIWQFRNPVRDTRTVSIGVKPPAPPAI